MTIRAGKTVGLLHASRSVRCAATIFDERWDRQAERRGCNTMEERLYRLLLALGIAGLITTFVVLVLLLFYWAVDSI
jgi:hypothetical protein